MTDTRKPKMFDLYISNVGEPIHACENPTEWFEGAHYAKPDLRVIELSAYADLQKQLEQAKAELKIQDDANEILTRRLDEANAELEELKLIISGKTFSYPKELESERAKSERYRKALESIAKYESHEPALQDIFETARQALSGQGEK